MDGIPDKLPGGFKEKFIWFMDVFGTLADGYERANPEWMLATYLEILGGAIENIKRLIEDPEEKEITWENPGAELAYGIKADWDNAEITYFNVTAEDLENPDKLRKLLGGGLQTVKTIYILRKITRDILVIKKGGKYFYKIPQALQNKLNKLPEKESNLASIFLNDSSECDSRNWVSSRWTVVKNTL